MALRDWFRFDFLSWRLAERPRRFVTLVRHFFIRFFQNDVMPFEDQMKEKLYLLLAVLATIGWFLTSMLFGGYVFEADYGQSWLQKCELLSFYMVLLAFITLLEWDALFVDRRDYANLAGLPVRPKTIFRSKFVSLLFFVLLYTAAADLLSGFAIGFYLPQWMGNSIGSFVLLQIGQMAAMLLAFYFTFFLVLSLEALLLFLLGPRLFRPVSLVVRFVLITACFAFLASFLVNQDVAGSVFEKIADLRRNDRSLFLLIPPVWFTGIYEKIIGRGLPVYDAAAARGIASVLVLGLFSYFAVGWTYRKHMRRSLEVRVRKPVFRRAGERLARVFDSLVLRNPVDRAVFHYFGRTLQNSARLKLRLAGMMAVALGFLMVIGASTTIFPGSAKIAELNVIGIPIVLAAALLLAFRSGVNVPLTAEANWIFRLTEAPPRRAYFVALKKAVFFYGLLPLFLAMFGVHAFLWGPGQAALHALYGLICSLFFREVLFWKYAKIPFSCLVVPGKAKVQYFWIVYLVVFFLTVSILNTIERVLFRNPSAFPVFFAVAAALYLGLALYQRLFVYEKLTIVYEEEPEPLMVTL